MGHFDSCWTEACIRLNFVLPDAINLKKNCLLTYIAYYFFLSLSLYLSTDLYICMYVCIYFMLGKFYV